MVLLVMSTRCCSSGHGEQTFNVMPMLHQVKTNIECYVSLSGLAEANNCEGLESVFPRILVRLSRVAKIASVGSLWPWYTGFDSCIIAWG
jgi:hypothetical protein